MVLKVTSPSSNNPGSSPSTAEEVPEFSFQRGRERPVPARLSGSRCLSALRTGLPMKVGRGGGRGRLPSKSGSARSAPNLSELSDSRAGAGHATTITRKAAQTSELVEHKRHSQAAAKQVSRARNSGSTACQWRRREGPSRQHQVRAQGTWGPGLGDTEDDAGFPPWCRSLQRPTASPRGGQTRTPCALRRTVAGVAVARCWVD